MSTFPDIQCSNENCNRGNLLEYGEFVMVCLECKMVFHNAEGCPCWQEHIQKVHRGKIPTSSMKKLPSEPVGE